MNKAEGGAPSAAPQADNPWVALKNVSFGGAPAGNISNRATDKAEVASTKANAKLEDANNDVRDAEGFARENFENLDAVRQNRDDIRDEITLKEEAYDKLGEDIDNAKAELQERKANNRFSKYIRRRSELAGQVLKAGGNVVAGAFKGFTAKVVAKMPRIEIQSPIKIRSNEQIANETKQDRMDAAAAAYDADSDLRKDANEKVINAAIVEEELQSRKNSFQEALEAFRSAKVERAIEKAGIKADKKELKAKKQEYEGIEEDLAVLDFNLEYAQNEMAEAGAVYEKAEKALTEAKAKAEAAEKDAKEKALKFDRLQTLARFKAELGGKSVDQVRSEVMIEKNAYEKFLKSIKEELLDPEAIESTRKEYEDKLNALDIYEAEIGKSEIGDVNVVEAPAAAEAEPVVAEAETADAEEEDLSKVIEFEPAAAAKKADKKSEGTPRKTFTTQRGYDYFNWMMNEEDEEERRRKAAVANPAA